MRDEHLYASYAIVPPQIDRSKPAHKQSDPDALCRRGQGARRRHRDLRRAAARDRRRPSPTVIHLSCIHPLQPGDENYANCVAVPVNAPGVKLYPRRPFAIGADQLVRLSAVEPLRREPTATSSSTTCSCRGSTSSSTATSKSRRDQWWKTPSHLYGNHQAQVRYVTKLRFMIGLAQRMNEMTGNAGNPAVQIMMGELAALVSIYETMLLAHETMAPIEDGVLWPSKTALYSAMALQSELNGRMLEIIRELAGSAMITLPSSLHDFENPETAADVERYMRSASSDAKSRVALMRLALGFHRLGIRQPPPAVREVLRRRVVPGEAERLSQLRLQARHRAGRRRAQPAADCAVATRPSTKARTASPRRFRTERRLSGCRCRGRTGSSR